MNTFLRSTSRRLAIVVAAATVSLAITSVTHGGVIPAFNVNQAFLDNEAAPSGPSNPNGAYSYGYSYPTDPSNPNQFGPIQMTGLSHTTAFANSPGIQGYYIPNNASVPAVVANVTDQTVVTSYGRPVQAGELLLHPGGTGSDAFTAPYAYADLRYTVPTGGDSLFNISGNFALIDFGGTDVHIAVNGQSVFDGLINSGSPVAAFNLSLPLAAGNTIDFLVGPGGNGIGSDSTGLYANIVATPEPATFISVGLGGLLALGFARYRRRTTPAIA